ncbi:MAG: protein kinase [Acidobacteriota bacterium]
MSDRPVNPYTNRLMIRNADDFIGRRAEIEKIFSRVGATRPQSISVIGERRIGKSSLLYQLFQDEERQRHLIDPDSYTFVFIDLHGLMGITVDEFLELFVEEVALAADLEPQPTAPTSSGYIAVRRLLPRLEAAGKKLVVLWDEFEAITRNKNFSEDFFSFFRSVANRFDVAYVTTSTRELQELCHTEEIAVSPFFNIFTNLYLGAFSPEEARALIRRPSAAAGIPLEPHEDFLIEVAGYLPIFQQILCCTLFEELIRSPVGDTTFEEVTRHFATEADPHLRYIWEHLDDETGRLLQRIAEGSQPAVVRGDIEEHMLRDGYVVHSSPGPYKIASSALRDFLLKQPDSTPAAEPDSIALQSGMAAISDRFTIIREVGHGAMGYVALARDNLLNQEVALKVLARHLYEDAGMVLRFKRETALARELHHPNICPVYDLLEEKGYYYIAMKYIDGVTLKERLAESGPLGIADLQNVGCQILRALSEAHHYLIHRDIKPQNIMLDGRQRAYLTDFGLACRPPEAGETHTGVLVGTPGYMAPEQIEGQVVDQRSDLYAFGAVLYEMATGERVFEGNSIQELLRKHVSEPPPRPSELRPDIPGEIEDLILELLEKNPDGRPPSAVAVLSRLGSRQGERGWGELVH